MNERILIVKTSSLGDVFHALPAVHLLKTGMKAEIDWVMNTAYAPLGEYFTDVSEVIPFPRNDIFPNLGTFFSNVRKNHYDLVIDMQGLLKSALIARVARAPRRIGPSFHREFSHLFYDQVTAERNKERHAVDENIDTLRFLNLPTGPVEFPVSFPPSSLFPSSNIPNSTSHILLSPCSRHLGKNWPIERFTALGTALLKRSGTEIIITGSPEDSAACGKLEQLLSSDSVQNLCGKTSLVELGGILQAMDLVISVDSGPMHMAAAVGTPTLALFGPTDPLRVGPYGSQHRVLRNTSIAAYSKNDMESILGISAEMALATAREMLGATE